MRGILAIEFDFNVDTLYNDPGGATTHIAVMKANPDNGLLSANHLFEVAKAKSAFNFVYP